MKIIIVHSLTEKQWRLNRLLFLKFTYSWSHLCSSFISVAAIKMPEGKKKQLKGFISAYNPRYQSIIAGKSRQELWTESHVTSTSKSREMDACLLACLLACAQVDFSTLIQSRTPDQGMVTPKVGWVFPHQLTLIIKTIPTDRPIGTPSPDDYSLKSLPK